MSTPLKEQFNRLKSSDQFTPDRVWVEKNRTQLLSQISNTVEDVQTPSWFERSMSAFDVFMPKRLMVVARPVFVLFLAFFVGISGYGVRAASANSLPGDALYSVKRASESVQSVFVKEKVLFEVERAQNRIEEVKQLNETQAQVSSQTLTKTIQSLSKHIEDAGEFLEEQKQAAVDNTSEKQTEEIEAEIVNAAIELAKTKQQIEDLEEDVVDIIITDEASEEGSSEEDIVISDITLEVNKAEDSLEIVQSQAIDQVLEIDDVSDDQLKELVDITLEEAEKETASANAASSDIEEGSDVVGAELEEVLAEEEAIEEEFKEEGTEEEVDLLVDVDLVPDTTQTSTTFIVEEELEEENEEETSRILNSSEDVEEFVDGVVKNTQEATDEIERTIEEVKEVLVDETSTGELKEALRKTQAVLRDSQGLSNDVEDAEDVIDTVKDFIEEQQDVITEETVPDDTTDVPKNEEADVEEEVTIETTDVEEVPIPLANS